MCAKCAQMCANKRKGAQLCANGRKWGANGRKLMVLRLRPPTDNREFFLSLLSRQYTPFQNGSNEAKKGARQKFVHFWKALTILMLKKYLKS